MLSCLTIRDVVLIESLILDVQGGFSALTGETGAGKSILLDSLGLALGGRADAGLVRKGAAQAVVSAAFDIADRTHPVWEILRAQDVVADPADGALIFRRTLSADGRSRAFINDQPVSVGFLKQAGALLVEIHGQFDTHGLLDIKTHRALLDSYARIDVGPVRAAWQAWRTSIKELDAATAQAEAARKEEDYLRHVTTELDALAPEAGEEARLSQQRETMKHRATLLSALEEIWQCLSGEGGAELSVGRAARALSRMGDRAPAPVDPVIGALDRAAAELQDAVRQIEQMQSDIQDNGLSAEDVEDRLYALRAAARKHGCAVDDLPEMHQTLAEKLALVERSEGTLAALASAAAAAQKDYVVQAGKISDLRMAAAGKLDALVAKELPPLKLEKARFYTDVKKVEEGEWGPEGADQVHFLVATNPGAHPGPLHKIASGGEMSRFMLALKVVMADSDRAGTYIFDEVDSGIGGATADAVGERLARLSKARQILVVTHAPQVAARADHHFVVEKSGGRAVRTDVKYLPDRAARCEEIARMLSGASVTAEARAAADKLLDTGT